MSCGSFQYEAVQFLDVYRKIRYSCGFYHKFILFPLHHPIPTLKAPFVSSIFCFGMPFEGDMSTFKVISNPSPVAYFESTLV